MGHSRPRYNAKGRNLPGDGSSKPTKPSSRKSQQGQDTNVDMLDPQEQADKKAERRAALLSAEQARPEEFKMSSKKKKRMDKFIDKQLKKERRVQLLQDISAYEQALPQDIHLQSSSSLGSKKLITAQDKLEQAQKLKERRLASRNARARAENIDLSDSAQSDSQEDQEETSRPAHSKVEVVKSQTHPSTSAITLGSGLKRSADGSMPVPTVTKRRRVKTAWGRLPVEDMDEDATESEFDSSDSANDTDSEDGILEEDDKDSDEEKEWGGIASDRDSQGDLKDRNQATDVQQPSSSQSGSEDSEEESGSEDDDEDQPKRQKGSFKAWAQAQRDQLEGHVQSETPAITQVPQANGTTTSKRRNSVTLPEGLGPLGEVFKAPTNSLALSGPQSTIKQRTVTVDRPEELQEARMQLPVLAEEDNIMHLIRHHSVMVLSGETGSGKTTQVPQFLYEAGFGDPAGDNPGMIGITQPRRVAAVSMAQRVRSELALPSHSHVVAHQVRYDSTTARETRIKFMTDGVLLRELGQDFLLQKYSVIIVDEAHERTVNTDILLGVLSRVVKLREDMWRKQEQGVKPLRLVIMSATLRLADFLNNKSLFPKTPESITVGSRQYPVTNHFARRTKSDYLGEAFKKVCKIHARLPPGGVLVFLTGQQEIQALCKRLERRWSPKAIAQRKARREAAASRANRRDSDSEDSEEDEEIAPPPQALEAEDVDLGQEKDLTDDIDDRTASQEHDEEDLESDDENDEDDGLDQDEDMLEEESDEPLYILPLYSLLPTEKQMKVFQPIPEGMRLVVVSTNVAETSLTIPGVRYVVDSGRAKERRYDASTGMQSFEVSWVSKASASQRAGRAGRVGPGHCYRLYSSAVYERYLDDHAQPEILRMPVESMVLQMKAMNIDVVTNFPFPTPPDRAALHKAERLLTQLGALQETSVRNGVKAASSLQITELGRAMSLFPLPPRFSKMLVAGQSHGCLPYVISMVCALVVGDPFLREDAVGVEDTLKDEEAGLQTLSPAEIQHIKDPDVKAKELRRFQRKQFFQVQAAHSTLGGGSSDMFKLLSAVGAYEYEGGSVTFCDSNFLRHKAMEEIHKLRAQVMRLVMVHFPKANAGLDPSLAPPSELQLKVLRQLVLSSFVDQVAVRKDLVDASTRVSAKHHATAAHVPYRALGVHGEDVYIHPSSVLYSTGPPPEFLCYEELLRTSRPWLKVNTRVPANWLSTLGKAFCSYSKVLETPDQLVRAKSGEEQEDVREVYVTPSFGDGSWGKGVELPPVKVTQKRVGGRWVVTG